MARPRLEGARVTPGGSSGLTQEMILRGQPQAQAPVSPSPASIPLS